MDEQRLRRSLNIVFFVLYLFLLVNFVLVKGKLFDRISPSNYYGYYELNMPQSKNVGVNLVPLQTIKGYYKPENWNPDSTKTANVMGNIVLFMPLGFLVPLIFPKTGRLVILFFLSLLVSVLFEGCQYYLQSGFADVDDVILNTAGGVFGYGFFAFIYR
jgi:glycopeptide antibiotics resistance protein